jgi:arylsulfatase
VRNQLLRAARSANVVICVLDAARADHVGCYGYPRQTTPNLDQLAKESVVFRNHFATFPATEPSTRALLTGLYPDASTIQERRGAKGAFTLERELHAAGFATALFTSNMVASPEVGIGTDFEQVFGDPSAGGQGGKQSSSLSNDFWRTPEGLTQAVARWLPGVRGRRFFAYCHFLPPHNPYNAPETFQRVFRGQKAPPVRRGGFEFREVRPPYAYGGFRPPAPADWVNQYDANLRWADWGVGEVVRLLRKYDMLDDTLLIVTADHGEAFGEHGYVYHMFGVYDELLHVPLLIRFPGQQRRAGEVKALTQTVDLLPTILDVCQIPYPREAVHGSSLVPLLDGEKTRVRDYVFATCANPCRAYLARDGQWSLMVYHGGKLRALYDLRTDPGQTHNVIHQRGDVAAKMTTALEQFARMQRRSLDQLLAEAARPQRRVRGGSPAAAPGISQRKLSDRARRELRALGYLR